MKKLTLTMGLALAMTAGLPAIASANHGGAHYGGACAPPPPPPQMVCRPACRPACPPPVVCRPACDPCDPCRRSGLLGLGILGIL